MQVRKPAQNNKKSLQTLLSTLVTMIPIKWKKNTTLYMEKIKLATKKTGQVQASQIVRTILKSTANLIGAKEYAVVENKKRSHLKWWQQKRRRKELLIFGEKFVSLSGQEAPWTHWWRRNKNKREKDLAWILIGQSFSQKNKSLNLSLSINKVDFMTYHLSSSILIQDSQEYGTCWHR